MFWESRGELGSDPAVKQNAYMLRTERYFTGGTRNPANCPAVDDVQAYNAYNYTWHGMSSFMTARSAMSWDLAEEPLITHFNLGNGKFFNLNGVRQHDKSWYNIGVQDYLPTWRWWFATKLLGRNAADVPRHGLDASFTWDDAYFGGSTVRISGSVPEEYLHLFKTQYSLKKGDVISIHFDMPVRTVVANLNVKDDEGRVAVERGPIVYCAEAADNQGEPVLRAVMGKKPVFNVVDGYKVSNTEAKGAAPFAVKAITTEAQMLEDTADGVAVKNQKLTLIPYYAWNHRGAGEMNVWFVQSLRMLDK